MNDTSNPHYLILQSRLINAPTDKDVLIIEREAKLQGFDLSGEARQMLLSFGWKKGENNLMIEPKK